MARYTNSIKTEENPDDLEADIEDYLKKNGFSLYEPKENVWKKGMGILTGPQFISFEVKPGKLILEAWIKFALFPGVYVGEMGTEGFFAFIPKKQLKNNVEAIEDLA